VEIVEPLGAETHLYLTTGAHGIVARTRTRQHREPGETVPLTFDLSKCHFFDGLTGTAVAHG
jgi:multiple sugar transport system ATP-binding protein